MQVRKGAIRCRVHRIGSSRHASRAQWSDGNFLIDGQTVMRHINARFENIHKKLAAAVRILIKVCP